jgi:hypothetical protein
MKMQQRGQRDHVSRCDDIGAEQAGQRGVRSGEAMHAAGFIAVSRRFHSQAAARRHDMWCLGLLSLLDMVSSAAGSVSLPGS